MKPEYKKGLQAFLFYIVAIILVMYFSKTSRSGPCTIGFDIISFVLAIGIGAVLFLRSIVGLVGNRKLYRTSTVIHGLAWIVFLIWWHFWG
jgi:hypothetical protein